MAHALIFGASGVSGWAIARQALQYPAKDLFATVTALTNRPLSRADSMLPDDARLQLVSGIDLAGSVDSIVAGLKDKVRDISTVSHVFFTAYLEKPDYPSLVQVNELLLRNAIQAVEATTSKLRTVILQTGGKYYGVEFADKVAIIPPLKETQPRVPKPYAENIFYYNQYDALAEYSKDKPWRFYEVRPDVIVGFTPGSNFMNITQGLAFYLTLFRTIQGEGARVPFIGTPETWTNTHTDTSQDILARQELYLAVKGPDVGVPNGSSFNAADGSVTTWQDKWPELCRYFGLEGAPPGKEPVDVGRYAKENSEVWTRIESEKGLRRGIFEKYNWGFVHGVCTLFNFNREYHLAAIRKAGFEEGVSTLEGYTTAFDRMRKAKIIP